MKLTDLLNELSIHYCLPGQHHHVREGWVGVDCPWCPTPRGDKGKYRLGIEVSSGRTNCWTCGKHSLVSALHEISKVHFNQIKKLLEGVELRKLRPDDKFRNQAAGKLLLPKGVGPLGNPHMDYLRSRGFDPTTVEKLWDIGGIGLASKLQWRIFIPITLNDETISWTTRSISDQHRRRYVSASPAEELVHFKDSCYGIDLVRTTAIIVEGPTDVWRIGPGAVALYGLNFTPAQVDLLRRFPHKVVCFDNEYEAQKRARELCETLSLFPGKVTNVCLDAEDPGSADVTEIKRLRKLVLER